MDFRAPIGFKSREEHDETLLANIEDTCGKRDTLYLLGDIYFNTTGYEFAERLRSSVGHLHLILGNHDFGNGKKQDVLLDFLNRGYIDSIKSLSKYKKAWLSHAPIHPEELRGRVNIHGHVHYATLDDDRYFNLSVENTKHLRPVSYDDIISREGLVR